MPTNPVLSARGRAGTDWRAVAADAIVMIIGWSLLCLILHYPEAMLVLVALPIGWRAVSFVSGTGHSASSLASARRKPGPA